MQEIQWYIEWDNRHSRNATDLYTHLFMMSGADNPMGQNFDVNRNLLSLQSFVASFKKISSKTDVIQFFSWFYSSIQPLGRGRQPPRGQTFDVNRNVLSLHSFVASLKKTLWSLLLSNFFHDLIHVYSPGAEADSPQGTKFWCQQKGLLTLPICCKFQRN